jgi:hypothetical protein
MSQVRRREVAKPSSVRFASTPENTTVRPQGMQAAGAVVLVLARASSARGD